jgi:putative transposase
MCRKNEGSPVNYTAGELTMRKYKFTEERIINILKSVEAGQNVADACCSNGISEHTYHRWKAMCGGLDVNEVRRMIAPQFEA